LTEEGSKCCCVEASGGEHADGAVGGGETFFCGDAAEGGLKPAEEGYLRAAKQGGVAGCVRGSVQAPGRLKRIADGSDSGCPRGSQYGAQDGGEHVDVLVAIDVGEADSTRLKEGDLRGGFGFDFGCDLSARG
jgi:hypothetical protein